eukprot:TRINITY_DN874_c0_g1_i1.p1 TRINITY_DN874_c0_g1~~TRINITY_DN874_c0_g1_i1.p1  ORF type:complete len:416 (+),score=144.48 TRINITY_DN874_c0_g1_i1:156-1403(+)
MNAKIFFEGQIRRTTLDAAPTFESLKQKLSKLFGEPDIESENLVNIRYSDEDGDLIDMSTDEELTDAIKWVKTYQQVIHIHISRREKKEEQKEVPKVEPQNIENPIQFASDLLENVNVEQFKPFINQLESLAKEFLGSANPNDLISQVEQLFRPVEVKKEESQPKEQEKEIVEEKKEEEVEKPVHFAMCDKCRKRIVGVRHKCQACADYDLCESCIQEKDTVHDASHAFSAILKPVSFFMPSKRVASEIVHHATCDSCQDRIVGLRFKCESCPDYDLCGLCFQNQEEIHPAHGFRIIEKNDSVCPRNRCCFVPSVQVAEPVAVSYDNSVAPIPDLVESEAESSNSSDEEEEPEAEAEVEIRDSQIQPGMTREKLQDALKQLQEMGFADRERNVRLIIQNKGDVVATILNLLNQEN